MKTRMSKVLSRFFKVFYVKQTGGQVHNITCEWNELSSVGEYIRFLHPENVILYCSEIK